ncbi:MAG: SRPBCC domain-containing protein [Acidobacteriota bacterium]
MPDGPTGGPPQFLLSTVVEAPAVRVMQAFFSHTDLTYWWRVERSVTVARASGPFAVTWPATDDRDDLLGQLGGTLHGTVMDCMANRAVFVADVYWQPPQGDPLGPMALEITFEPVDGSERTKVSVRQSASDDGPRWQRYFALTKVGWSDALATLKDYLENEWLYRVKSLKQAKP